MISRLSGVIDVAVATNLKSSAVRRQPGDSNKKTLHCDENVSRGVTSVPFVRGSMRSSTSSPEYWSETTWPVLGKPGTPFVFDIGVYLVVLGTVTAVIFELMESEA